MWSCGRLSVLLNLGNRMTRGELVNGQSHHHEIVAASCEIFGLKADISVQRDRLFAEHVGTQHDDGVAAVAALLVVVADTDSGAEASRALVDVACGQCADEGLIGACLDGEQELVTRRLFGGLVGSPFAVAGGRAGWMDHVRIAHVRVFIEVLKGLQSSGSTPCSRTVVPVQIEVTQVIKPAECVLARDFPLFKPARVSTSSRISSERRFEVRASQVMIRTSSVPTWGRCAFSTWAVRFVHSRSCPVGRSRESPVDRDACRPRSTSHPPTCHPVP